MPKENDLEGAQDQGGKHGGQAGMPDPTPKPEPDAPGAPDEISKPGRRPPAPPPR